MTTAEVTKEKRNSSEISPNMGSKPVMSTLHKQIYRFGDVEVDTARGCLRRGEQEQHLRQKTFQVLMYLLEHRERLVTKEELMENVWKETAVTDDALVQCVKEIRRALGDDPRHPRFIKTIPKVGYRFICPIEEHSLDRPMTLAMEGVTPVELAMEEVTSVEVEYEEDAPNYAQLNEAIQKALPPYPTKALPAPVPRRWLSRKFALVSVLVVLVAVLSIYIGQRFFHSKQQLAEVTLPQAPGKKSLAVMYFENQSGSTELDWLREGLADMLINDLSRSAKLTVLSRQQLHLLLERSGHRPSNRIQLDEALDIARRSRAEAIVLGSFARLGEKVRIDVKLHETRTGHLQATESIITDRPEQILTQIDLLSLKLTSHLGAALTEQDTRRGLAGVMTNNLDSYRYYSLALEQTQMFQFPEAIALLEKAIALDPQFAMAYARVGYIYAVRMGQGEKAQPYLEKAFQLADRLTEKDKLYIAAWYASAKHDPSSAIRTYQEMIAQYPIEIEAYQRLAWLLLLQNRTEEAHLTIKQGLVIDPEAKDLYNALGHVYQQQGKDNEAIAAFQRYVQLAPADPNAYDSLGSCHQWFGRYDEAIAAYQRALALNPESRVAIIHLGHVYFQSGRYQAAIDQYQRFVQVARDDHQRSRGYQSITHVYLKKRDLDQADTAAKQATKYAKTVMWNSLEIAFARGDRQTAEKFTAEFLAKLSYPQLAERGLLRFYYYYLGYLALKDGRAAEAMANFKEALRRQPVNWDIDPLEDCLANAYLELGQLDEAIAEYERILSVNPNYPLAHYHLGQAYERKGQPERARAAYERFLQIWRDADADLTEVIAAKERLAKS